MPKQTYGTLEIVGDKWVMRAEPSVALMAKRIFQKLKKDDKGVIRIDDTRANARDIDWFLMRYPMEMDAYTLGYLKFNSKKHEDHLQKMHDIVAGEYDPKLFDMALPARPYQATAATLFLKQKFLLLGDDLGLGKTVSAIASFCDPRTLPVLVVCHPFLQRQWQEQLQLFLPRIRSHEIRQLEEYILPSVDVYVISYNKLSAWAGRLCGRVKTVVFDECQELRREDSHKYNAAKMLCDRVQYKLGLSATPLFNYGGEIFNVLNCLQDGCLGAKEEFVREWCHTEENAQGRSKLIVDDPVALGNYLRREHLMLRRTRKEIGRELPEVMQIIETVDCNMDVLNQIRGKAAELARLILSRTNRPEERMVAAGQLDNMIRQQTGIAKAPFVAEFVRMLVESGDRVLLFGWHRAVYELWQDFFTKAGVKFSMFTGTETANEKQATKNKLMNGDIDVLIMSLRSGAGIDGLQQVCNTVCFGELDWTPAIHAQCIGRLHRDGQDDKVAAYFLAAEDGADPLMLQVLGVKGAQIAGITDGKETLSMGRRDTDHIRKLAMQYLRG